VFLNLARRPNSQTLNSWKEIADYMGRGVRTVQRWERDLHLPVRRLGKSRRSPVVALVSELNFWISTVGPLPSNSDFKPKSRKDHKDGLGRKHETHLANMAESKRLMTSITSWPTT